MNRLILNSMITGLLIVFSISLPMMTFAQIKNGEVPDAEKGTGVVENLGDEIDLGIYFRDDRDRKVQLGDFFDGSQPVILSFNYSDCPKLCSVQLENMAMALRKIDLKVEDDFQVISVSIDPLEQVSRARASKEKFLTVYGDESTKDGWHFLVGKRDSIEVLADNCGFKYKYIPHQKLYSHPPLFLMLSPEGKIVRYIHGLDYEPITIKRALVEAAKVKIGSSINRLTYITGCFLFDESSGKYTPQAMGIMRIGGALTAVFLIVGLVPYWFLGRNTTVEAVETDRFDSPTDLTNNDQ
ncbi:MAG: SCO family protein [Planctomycetota bacterium]